MAHTPWHKDAKAGFPNSKAPESVFGKELGDKLLKRGAKHPRRMDARLGRIYGEGKPVPKEAKARALSSKMGKATRKKVEGM